MNYARRLNVIRKPLDHLVPVVATGTYKQEVVYTSIELLHQGLQFSESWWSTQPHRNHWFLLEYTRNIAMCLHEYRSQDEVLDGTSFNLYNRALLTESRNAMWPSLPGNTSQV